MRDVAAFGFRTEWLKSRGSHFLLTIARLRPGVSLERAAVTWIHRKQARVAVSGYQHGQGIKLTPVPEQLVQDVRPAY